MITIDRREGSKEFLAMINQLGPEAELDHLNYGDFVFEGNGPGSKSVMIAVERKTISDLLDSMQSGRLSGRQLYGLVEVYDYVYLVVEGHARPGREPNEGVLQIKRGNEERSPWINCPRGRGKTVTYSSMTNYLATLESFAGLRVRRTTDMIDTAHTICNLYSWWQKRWEDHSSHKSFNVSGEKSAGTFLLRKPKKPERVLNAMVDGMGWDKSRALVSEFKNLDGVLAASDKDLLKVKGIGKELVRRLRQAMYETE